MKKSIFLCFVFIFLIASSAFAQGSLTLTTYYPAPFGVYQRVRITQDLIVGADANTNPTAPYRVEVHGPSGSILGNGIFAVRATGMGTGVEIGAGVSRGFIQAGSGYPSPDTTRSLVINPSGGNVGINTNLEAPAAALHVQGGAFLVGGATGDTPVTGEIGTRMMWIPSKGAFRAGTLTSGHQDKWNHGNIGTASFAVGYNTRAQGDYSIAAGVQADASGNRSIAMGNFAKASGASSVALGSGEASGNSSVALGSGEASGASSVALGSGTASGDSSVALGTNIEASGSGSFVIGTGTSSIDLTNSIANSLMVGFDTTIPIMFVNQNSVGIGTTAPQADLHVEGGAFFRGGSGDVDANGTIHGSDATLILNYLNSGGDLTEGRFARADVTGSGIVSRYDSQLIGGHFSGALNLNDPETRMKIKRPLGTSIYPICENMGGGACLDGTGYGYGIAKDAIRVSKEGDVGVGTTGPRARVHIHAPIPTSDPKISYGLAITDENLVQNDTIVQYLGKNTEEGMAGMISFTHKSTTIQNMLSLGFSGINPNILNLRNWEGGRVGIKTMNPSADLHVEGDVRITNSLDAPIKKGFRTAINDTANSTQTVLIEDDLWDFCFISGFRGHKIGGPNMAGCQVYPTSVTLAGTGNWIYPAGSQNTTTYAAESMGPTVWQITTRNDGDSKVVCTATCIRFERYP